MLLGPRRDVTIETDLDRSEVEAKLASQVESLAQFRPRFRKPERFYAGWVHDSQFEIQRSTGSPSFPCLPIMRGHIEPRDDGAVVHARLQFEFLEGVLIALVTALIALLAVALALSWAFSLSELSDHPILDIGWVVICALVAHFVPRFVFAVEATKAQEFLEKLLRQHS
jgi:hypothetical protein